MNCPVCLSTEISSLFNDSNFSLFKCHSCNIVFLRSDLRELYKENYFSNKRRRYYQNYRYNYNQNLFPVPGYKSILNQIKESGVSGKLLDIGCGKGILLDLARKAGFETTGIDISSYTIQYARKYFNLNAICGNLLDINFPEKSFDVVTMIDLLEHTDQPESLLKEIRRLLKSRGLLVIVTPNEEALINKLSYAIYRLSREKIRSLVKLNHAPEHRYYFSLKSLDYLLQKSGYRIIDYHYHEIDPALMDYGLSITLCARVVFYLARLLRQQHKMTIFARKRYENYHC